MMQNPEVIRKFMELAISGWAASATFRFAKPLYAMAGDEDEVAAYEQTIRLDLEARLVEEATALFAGADLDGDGTIDIDECRVLFRVFVARCKGGQIHAG